MPRGVKKENLPTKVCVTCERPFTWRKKWERVWDEVTTCSKSCNRKRKSGSTSTKNNGESKINSVVDDASSLSAADAAGELDSLVANFSNFDIVDSTTEEASEAGNVKQIITKLETDDVITQQNDCIDDNDESSQTSSTSKNSSTNEQSTPAPELVPSLLIMDAKAQRKEEKKRKKAERRAQREGRGDPTAGQKQCTLCNKSVNLLIRCTYDGSGEWGMVCGKCWNGVSGGVVDGDDAHPHYRYGGLWKNRRAQS